MPEIVITYLQMNAFSELLPARHSAPELCIREVSERDGRLNRSLYLLVGERWSWIDKQSWNDEQWADYARSGQLRTFVATSGDATAGYYELHRDDAQAVEIAYFGLAPDFIGRGLGGLLLTDALQRAWAWDARRVWVHTCSLDHPAALKNYQARGMQIYDRQTQHVG